MKAYDSIKLTGKGKYTDKCLQFFSFASSVSDSVSETRKREVKGQGNPVH